MVESSNQKGPSPMLILWVVVSGALWNIGIAFGHEHWLVPASGMMGSLPQVNLLEMAMIWYGDARCCFGMMMLKKYQSFV